MDYEAKIEIKVPSLDKKEVQVHFRIAKQHRIITQQDTTTMVYDGNNFEELKQVVLGHIERSLKHLNL